MKIPYSKDDLIAILTEVSCEVIGCLAEEMGPDIALVDDLGADSLDAVQLTFAVGKRLNIVLPKRPLVSIASELVEEETLFLENNGLTDLGVALLRLAPNAFTSKQLRPGMNPYEVFAASTVTNWANLSEFILNQIPESCPDCGCDETTLGVGNRLQCVDCGVQITPMNGDEALRQRLGEIINEMDCEYTAAA